MISKNMTKIFFLETPENFNFQRTVFSHGWCELLPFEFDRENWRLSYVFDAAKTPVSATISEDNEKIKIETAGGKTNEEKLVRDVRHILRLDDDLSEFYALTGNELGWISATNSGRMLRSATVYEDLVKTICTTNCSWALTKKMTTNLVEKLGTPTADGKRAFPTAAQMAEKSVEFYKDEIRAGYRSAYFAELAESVANGKVNPESWLNSDLPTKELKKEMKSIKGVGDYAAENLLKLVGRYDGLALDSWLRSQFYKKRNDGTVCDDKKIEQHYEKFAHWRGLVMWLDMTERWHEENLQG